MVVMHLHILTLLSVILLACTLASTLSAVGTGDGVIHPSSALQLRNTRTDVTAHLGRRAVVSFSDGNGEVEASVLATSATVTLAVCGATGPIGCVIAATVAVVVNFLSIFGLSGRGIQAHSNVFLQLPPTPQKTHIERLTTELAPAVWHTIGHTHVNGFNHTLHFFNGGSFNKLRARQVPFLTSTTPQKRADDDDDDGTVVDYTWENESVKPFDDFPNTQKEIKALATDIVDYMNSHQAVAACSDLADPDGIVASGILSIGVKDRPFDFSTVGGEQKAFSLCKSNKL